MQYYYILVVVVVALFQLHNILSTRSALSGAGELLSTYTHKSSIAGIYLAILLQGLLIYQDLLKGQVHIIPWLLPTVVLLLLAYYRSSKKLMIYETGLLVFGDFIAWDRIDNIDIQEKELQIVASLKDTQYYTISHMEKAEQCYNQLIAHASHLRASEVIIKDNLEACIEDFLK